jgi:magnesium chelatase family protein
MDLVVQVQPTPRELLAHREPGESSEAIRRRIAAARERQAARLRGSGWRTNAEIPARRGAMDRLCGLTPEANRLLGAVAERRSLSPRAQHRLRRVARTIMDLREPDAPLDGPVGAPHVAEAAHLRRLPDPDGA